MNDRLRDEILATIYRRREAEQAPGIGACVEAHILNERRYRSLERNTEETAMRRFALLRCRQCLELEQAHDRAMDEYIRLVEQQGRLFRQGNVRAGRDLDSLIDKARSAREIAVNALLSHGGAHGTAARRDHDSFIDESPPSP
jgi:hypothetical protein